MVRQRPGRVTWKAAVIPSNAVLVVSDSARLREGQALRFRVSVDGVEREAFAVRFRGTCYAYLNTCRHQSLPLDFGDAHFFDDAGGSLVCCYHGARYDPISGVCLDGPCEGGRLTALIVEEHDGALWCAGARRTARRPLLDEGD